MIPDPSVFDSVAGPGPAVQYLFCADPARICLQGLTAKDTAGWVLLHLQLRSVHKGNLKTLPSHLLDTDTSFRQVLRNALRAVTCGDLASTIRVGLAGEDVDSEVDRVAAAASSLVSATHGPREALVDDIAAVAVSADRIEEEAGIRQAVELLDPETCELCTSSSHSDFTLSTTG